MTPERSPNAPIGSPSGPARTRAFNTVSRCSDPSAAKVGAASSTARRLPVSLIMFVYFAKHRINVNPSQAPLYELAAVGLRRGQCAPVFPLGGDPRPERVAMRLCMGIVKRSLKVLVTSAGQVRGLLRHAESRLSNSGSSWSDVICACGTGTPAPRSAPVRLSQTEIRPARLAPPMSQGSESPT